MDWKTLLYRFIIFVLVVIAGGFLFAVTANLLIMFGLMPEGFDGRILAKQTTYVYMMAVLAGFISIFIKQNWRGILFFSPLYVPSVFAIVYTIIH